MTNGTATASSNERSTHRGSMQHSVIPALFIATGLALAYAGALAALLLGSH